MKRWLPVIAALLLGSAPPADAWKRASNAVRWSVDHKAKTIHVTVRLYLYPATPGQPITPEIRRSIESQIETLWNHQTEYRCYQLVVDADILAEDGGNPASAPDDRVGIRVVRDAAPFRSFISGEQKPGARWDSSSPSDRITPVNDPDHPASWGWPPQSTTTYPHEVGHIMGLSDSYIEWIDAETKKSVSIPAPLAPGDVMSTPDAVGIHQRTIDLLVQRSGLDLGRLSLPAEGEWKGTFKLVYEPIVKGMPPRIHTTVTWAGEISFTVQGPDSAAPAAPGTQGSPVRGRLKGGITMDLAGIPMPGAMAKAGQKSDREAVCELGVVELDPNANITRIEVKGDPAAIGFSYNIEAATKEHRGAKSGSTPGGTQGPVAVTYLEVDVLQCDAMRGHFDVTRFKELTGGQVTDMKIIENTWKATHIESGK